MKIHQVYKDYTRPDTTEKLVEMNSTLLDFESKNEIKAPKGNGLKDRSIDGELMDL